jgi:hypothetical protein
MKGVYKCWTLKTVKKFTQLYNLGSPGSGYMQIGNFDYGPIFLVLATMK